MKRVLILGATGLVGGLAVGPLARTNEAAVALVRRPSGATWPANVEERVVDFDAVTELPGFDAVVCALGTTIKKAGSQKAFRAIDLELPLRLARLATEGGAKRMALVSSAGASAGASTFYLRVKGELEEALAALPLEHLDVLRPGLLLGDRAEARLGERLAAPIFRGLSGLLAGGLRKYRAIDGAVVARALAGALLATPAPGVKVSIHEFDAIETLAKAAT